MLYDQTSAYHSQHKQLKVCTAEIVPLEMATTSKTGLFQKAKRDLQDLSLPKPPPLHGSIFPLHSTMFYAVALVSTSSKDNEISLDVLARENPKERKNSPFLV